jgi:hypothetical protein
VTVGVHSIADADPNMTWSCRRRNLCVAFHPSVTTPRAPFFPSFEKKAAMDIGASRPGKSISPLRKSRGVSSRISFCQNASRDPELTLDTYGHLWPDDAADRARAKAVEAAL